LDDLFEQPDDGMLLKQIPNVVLSLPQSSMHYQRERAVLHLRHKERGAMMNGCAGLAVSVRERACAPHGDWPE